MYRNSPPRYLWIPYPQFQLPVVQKSHLVQMTNLWLQPSCCVLFSPPICFLWASADHNEPVRHRRQRQGAAVMFLGRYVISYYVIGSFLWGLLSAVFSTCSGICNSSSIDMGWGCRCKGNSAVPKIRSNNNNKLWRISNVISRNCFPPSQSLGSVLPTWTGNSSPGTLKLNCRASYQFLFGIHLPVVHTHTHTPYL